MRLSEAVEKLNGREYRNEGSDEFFAKLKEAGIVAVFGRSDDRVQLRGEIENEVDSYDGTIFHVDEFGLCESKCECGDECPYFASELEDAEEIEAVWCPKDENGEVICSWAYKTTIPHQTFDIMEDGELYCRGIVFHLAQVHE